MLWEKAREVGPSAGEKRLQVLDVRGVCGFAGIKWERVFCFLEQPQVLEMASVVGVLGVAKVALCSTLKEHVGALICKGKRGRK